MTAIIVIEVINCLLYMTTVEHRKTLIVSWDE